MVENIENWSGVVSILALIVTWLIVQPLKTNIASLCKSLDRLVELMDVTKAEVNELRERMAKVEASTSSAHRRIDDLRKE